MRISKDLSLKNQQFDKGSNLKESSQQFLQVFNTGSQNRKSDFCENQVNHKKKILAVYM